MITYPDRPWTDGQSFEYVISDDEMVVGTYNQAKNAWTFVRSDRSTRLVNAIRVATDFDSLKSLILTAFS